MRSRVIGSTPRVKTLPEYLDAVRRIRVELTEGVATAPVWFRGHRMASWPLLPTLYRGAVDPMFERELLRDFKLRSGTLLQRVPSHDLEWLYVMRHYGIPTRILDWSESPLVALFFAIKESTGKEAARVWMLDPWSLNEWSIEQTSVPVTDRKALAEYVLHRDSSDDFSREVVARKAVAVRPQHAVSRAIGQSGMFTIHGSRPIPLESIVSGAKRPPWLRSIVVDAARCRALLRELFEAGITTSSIYPDLEGLAVDLTYRYSSDASDGSKDSRKRNVTSTATSATRVRKAR